MQFQLIGTPRQWQTQKETLEQIQGDLYCQEMRTIFAHNVSSEVRNLVLNPQQNPPFSVMIQILEFYQAYRHLEYSLFCIDPEPENSNLFRQEIIPILKRQSH